VARNKAQLGELLDGNVLWLFTKSAIVHIFSEKLVSYGPLACGQGFHLPLLFHTDVLGIFRVFLGRDEPSKSCLALKVATQF
jgi:hypothetical protein